MPESTFTETDVPGRKVFLYVVVILDRAPVVSRPVVEDKLREGQKMTQVSVSRYTVSVTVFKLEETSSILCFGNHLLHCTTMPTMM